MVLVCVVFSTADKRIHLFDHALCCCLFYCAFDTLISVMTIVGKYIAPLLFKTSAISINTSAFAESISNKLGLSFLSSTTAKALVGTLSATMTDHVTVSYVTVPNQEVARRLAKDLVKHRLAACVNIVKNVESFYEWREIIEQDEEILLIIKSNNSKTPDLTSFVEKNHPYDCPEVVTLKVESASEKYKDWIAKTLTKDEIKKN